MNININRLNVTYNLSYYRIKAKYTQKQLAEITGIGRSTISDIENNKMHPTIPIIIILCIVLKISIFSLVNYKLN